MQAASGMASESVRRADAISDQVRLGQPNGRQFEHRQGDSFCIADKRREIDRQGRSQFSQNLGPSLPIVEIAGMSVARQNGWEFAPHTPAKPSGRSCELSGSCIFFGHQRVVARSIYRLRS